MLVLDPAQAPPYFELVSGLFAVARPGALFPDAGRWRDVLSLLSRPGPKGRRLRVAVHERSGLPARAALVRLHRLQVVARAFFAQHRARPARDAKDFSAALAAVELPPVSRVEARLVGRTGGLERFVVVFERVDGRTGCPVRFTAQLEQRRAKHIGLARGDQARPSEAFQRELAFACDASAAAALAALRTLPGLCASEVVRGQVGPVASTLVPTDEADADVRALREALRGAAGPAGVLSLSLERAGDTVTADSAGDPWVRADETGEGPGFHVACERRLVCTPQLEPAVRAVVAKTGRPVLVRSR